MNVLYSISGSVWEEGDDVHSYYDEVFICLYNAPQMGYNPGLSRIFEDDFKQYLIDSARCYGLTITEPLFSDIDIVKDPYPHGFEGLFITLYGEHLEPSYSYKREDVKHG